MSAVQRLAPGFLQPLLLAPLPALVLSHSHKPAATWRRQPLSSAVLLLLACLSLSLCGNARLWLDLGVMTCAGWHLAA